MLKRRFLSLTLLALLAAPAALVSGAAATAGAQTRPLPTAFPDSAFWALSSGFSEPGGYFQSDNFTSNEMGYPQIVVDLISSGRKGGAYLGVGPEQNFQYMAAIRPQIVFQFDIRRQAVMQHLMYKAIFELSPDRADFLSLLFTKPRPRGLDTTTHIWDMWDAYWPVFTDTLGFTRNFTRIRDHLTRTHGFPLNAEDIASLGYVYEAFYRLGPLISYNGYNSPNASSYFASLTWASDVNDVPRSFLATEESYRFIKSLHTRNLIIPVVADFAGPSGIRSVARFLHEHNTPVTAFYVSNVEQYLFQNGVARSFYANVATLPLTERSVFIRPGGRNMPLCPIQPFLAINATSGINSYQQANNCGY